MSQCDAHDVVHYYRCHFTISPLHSSLNVARHSRTGLLQQGIRTATVQPALTPLQYRTLRDFHLEGRSFDLQEPNSVVIYSPPTTHLAEKSSLFSATSWQTALQQETHAQARIAGASHLFSFLVLSTALIRNGFSNILRAWIYAGYHAPVTTTTTASQSCRAHFNFTLYILHNLLSRIMETKNFTSSLPLPFVSLLHASMLLFSLFESVPLQGKLLTRPILALDACQRR